MVNMIEGNIGSVGGKIAIVVSRFNEIITERLTSGAVEALRRAGVNLSSVDLVKVPGAFEIPLAAKHIIESKKYSAVICLGAVIRGSTPHFEYVCSEVAKGISKLNLDSGVPVSFGLLTTDNMEQAMDRAGGKMGNKGAEAALVALEMASLVLKLRE